MAMISNENVRHYRQLFADSKISRAQICQETGMDDRSVRNFLNGTSFTQAGGPLSSFKLGRKPNVAKLVETQRS